MFMVKKVAKQKRKLSARPKHSLFLVLIGLLVCFVAYSQLHKRQKIAEEKEIFSQLEQRLAKFSDTVVASLGEPIQREAKGYCDRISVEFIEGDLYCGGRT